MKHGTTTSRVEFDRDLLNAPPAPDYPPIWEREDRYEISDRAFDLAMDKAIAYRKAHGMIPAK